MDQSSKYSINTLCVQGGYTPGNGEPRQIPIVQSTTFKYDSSDYYLPPYSPVYILHRLFSNSFGCS